MNSVYAREIPDEPGLVVGIDALAKHTLCATTAPSVIEAMQRTLTCVKEAGYSGGMISLVFEDGDKRWIVAHAALGKSWVEGVLPEL